MDVLEDVQKEHEKETRKLKKVIAELLDLVASLKNLNAELNEKRKQALGNYYETASKLEDALGIIVKLTAQMNHNYENSSLPSSKCINRKKITNNREKTGRKPGAQPGHPHHPRKPMKPDKVVEVKTEETFQDSSRYIPTGKSISRQVIGIRMIPAVTQYHTLEFYDKKKGRNVHSAFPAGVTDDVNYDESMKAVLFLLNSGCNVSLEKTAQFVSDVTDGALSPSVGMISGLCREFSLKSKEEQDALFKELLDAPVMHVDGTAAKVNGSNHHVIVCSNGMITVGKNTRCILENLTLEQIQSMVPEKWVMRILEEGGVTTDFRSVWLLVFWGRLTRGGMILTPMTDHHMMHLPPCLNNLPIFPLKMFKSQSGKWHGGLL